MHRSGWLLILLAIFSAEIESARAEPMTFTGMTTGGNMAGASWLAAEGEIVANTPTQFLEYLKKSPGCGEVVFDSPGGNLLAALKLGSLINEHCTETSVGKSKRQRLFGTFTPPLYLAERFDGVWDAQEGECASACVYAFMGGRTRNVSKAKSALYVHQFFQEKGLLSPNDKQFSYIDVTASQVTMGILVSYLMNNGVDGRLASIAASVPPSTVHQLTEAEIDALKVRKKFDQFPNPELKIVNGRLVAISKDDFGRSLTIWCSAQRKQIIYHVKRPIRWQKGATQTAEEARSYLNDSLKGIFDPSFGFSYEDGSKFEGIKLSPKQFSGQVTATEVLVSLALPISPETFSAKSLSISVYPNAYRGFLNQMLPYNDAGALLKVISNNCY